MAYTCSDARRDIDEFFGGDIPHWSDRLRIRSRFTRHIFWEHNGTTDVTCTDCADYLRRAEFMNNGN